MASARWAKSKEPAGRRGYEKRNCTQRYRECAETSTRGTKPEARCRAEARRYEKRKRLLAPNFVPLLFFVFALSGREAIDYGAVFEGGGVAGDVAFVG